MLNKPSVGAAVLFHEEGGPYASIVTARNPDGTLELVTFGRNSVYFQHNVRSANETDPLQPIESLKGRWTYLGIGG
jgi:hypothetical protein